MEEFNIKKLTAAVQVADRLAREVEAKKLEAKDLDEEAEHFYEKFEAEAEARRRLERHLAILNNMLAQQKRWPHGIPYEQSECHREHLRNLAEADRRVEEAREKAKKAIEKSELHMKLYQEDVKANLARDPDFYRRKPAPAHFRREFLDSRSKKALDAARAVWHKRFDCQLPEIMTTDQCNEALKIGYDILRYGSAVPQNSRHPA
jgi:hypothetical protein